MRKNAQVANILYEIADLLEIQNVQWKPQAYRKAAQSIENLSDDIEEVIKERKIRDVPGVGEAIAEKIMEIVKTGKLHYLEELRKAVPIKVAELSKIEGMGPKTLQLLYKKLKVKNLQDLKKAAEAGKIQKIPGMGAKKEAQILLGVQRLEKAPASRFPLGQVAPLAEDMLVLLKKVSGSSSVAFAGSYRRGKETVGDLDILLVSSQPKKAMEAFISQKDVAVVLANGTTKSSIRLVNGLQVDLRVMKKESYGAALQYFTGSKEHNVALRKIALRKGYTLNEYGLSTLKGGKIVAGKTEEEVYTKLGLQYVPPEMRENRGEIELGLKKNIPSLISLEDIHGDFQVQTLWSDGNSSIHETARFAESLGYKFITITDHVGGIGIARPLDEKRLKLQAQEIDTLNKKLDIHIFKGAEIDILKDGTLALSKKACKELDVVLASLHSSFRQSAQEMTKRICRAFEEFPVHIWGHPSARILNQRDPVDFLPEKVFQCAKEQGVFLEIDGLPSRMDLNDVHTFQAREMGCSFAMSSDAHSHLQLPYMKYSVLIGRRAWLEKKHVLNTKSVKDIEKILEKRKV